MTEKVENQIKTIGSSPLNAFLPRFFQNMDCLLCFGNDGIKQDDDSGRSMVIDFLAPPTQFGFYDTAAEVSNLIKIVNCIPKLLILYNLAIFACNLFIMRVIFRFLFCQMKTRQCEKLVFKLRMKCNNCPMFLIVFVEFHCYKVCHLLYYICYIPVTVSVWKC